MHRAIEELPVSFETVKGMLERARSLPHGRQEEAYEEILAKYANCIEAYCELGYLYVHKGLYGKAYHFLKNAIGHAPKKGDLWYLMGKCLFHLNRCDGALIAFGKADDLLFKAGDLKSLTARCFIMLQRYDEAYEIVEAMIASGTNVVNAWQIKAMVHEMRGEVDEAQSCYEKVWMYCPAEPMILYRLSAMNRLSEENYQGCLPEHRVHQGKDYSLDDLSYLHFARAIEADRRGTYEEAFEHYSLGNKAVRDQYDFDRDALIKRTNSHVEVFQESFFEKFHGYGLDSQNPIFILGMLRSGTTLVEQILSSHSDVCAGGEVGYFSRIENALIDASKDKEGGYPYSLMNMEASSLRQFGSQFLNQLQQINNENAPFVTDKMPTNFLHLGLISVIFPNAKIIHVKRNPIDTCLSCFVKRFSDEANLAFTFDLEDMGFFYNEYVRLMRHWEKVLQGKIYTVVYEDLVDNPDERVRGLLDYIGLPWDENCLKFYENKRGVNTGSMYQVRQPIYRSSMGRWKKYEKFLTPLTDILEKKSLS